MNFAHLHLLLNHFPIIGMIVGVGLFLVSFFDKNEDLRRGSYIVFVGIALLSIPAFLSGFGAQQAIQGPGVSDALINRHEGSALLSLWFVEATGVLAVIGLWQSQRLSHPSHGNVLAVLVLSLLAVGLIARTGNTGGDIRHPEIHPGEATTVVEGPLGSFISHFEPSPEKFVQLVSVNKWWWGFMMAMHFIGLILIVGTVGLLDVRIMGFMKQLPVAPLHRFLPWGLAGLGINIVTGLLAFVGQSDNYIYSGVFWLKMLSLLLLGVNAAAFYLTGIFGRVETVAAGEDAPVLARFVAATSLFLWFAVIVFGRYIQPLGSTLPRPN